MNNERYQEIINEAYRNYLIEDYKIMPNFSKEKMYEFGHRLAKEEFINKCKNEPEFSEKWGLKIEESELSLEERGRYAQSNHYEVSLNIKIHTGVDEDHTLHKQLDVIKIPTKLITITYNNETIEVYE